MKLMLAENIRLLRKQKKMTQERLAEALGVTVGAVYKWESGQSQPELNLLVEMADFFDTSVDVLLGYRIQDNRLDVALERLSIYCQTMDPVALSEAEKMLGKYPHSFKAVCGCAMVYLVFGAGSHDVRQLRRALELLEQAKVLLSQNDDPRISESTICGNMAFARYLLGEKEKSLELMKQNNAGGMFSSDIGAMLAIDSDDPEKAAPFLTEALVEGISTLLTSVFGYVFLFRARKDWTSAMNILNWGMDFLTGLKEEAKPGFFEKVLAEMLVLLAYIQLKVGMGTESGASLAKARTLAASFDSMPDYGLKTMRFADQTEQSLVLDIFGATATGGIASLIDMLSDQKLSEQWKELTENE